MGFVHDTESKILGVETRGESAILSDTDENTKHLHFHYVVKKSDVKEEIIENIMKQAGEFYAKGQSDKAEQYKQVADIVHQTALSPELEPYSFEASYEWLQELTEFLSKKEIFKKGKTSE